MRVIRGLKTNRPARPLVLALAFAAAVTGCGPRIVEKEGGDRGGENLLALSRVYMRAQEKNNRPPRSVEDLKPVAAEFGDRYAEHVGDALEDRHAVNGPDAALDLRDPAL